MSITLLKDNQQMQDFCQKNDIGFLGIFGSFSRGEEKTDSDIDILVDFNDQKSLMEIGGIQYDLQTKLGRPVDLVTRKNIKPEIKKYILKDLKVLYEKR